MRQSGRRHGCNGELDLGLHAPVIVGDVIHLKAEVLEADGLFFTFTLGSPAQGGWGRAADAGVRRPASRSAANALSSGALVALHYPGRFHFNAHGVQVAGQQFPGVLGVTHPNGLARAEIKHGGLAIGQRQLEAR